MKIAAVIGTSVLGLLLGTPAPAKAQHGQDEGRHAGSQKEQGNESTAGTAVFLAIANAGRTGSVEAWDAVMKCVCPVELRLRLQNVDVARAIDRNTAWFARILQGEIRERLRSRSAFN